MLINLVPEFLAVLESADPLVAYRRYFDAHRRVLEPYWHNYVLDPDSHHFTDVARTVILADRSDLRAVLDRTDAVSLARDTIRRTRALLDADVEFDVVLMVGVGAANAGELVAGGRGIAFACLEHFTGVVNPTTTSLGLDPELLPLWLAHEIAHAVRYTAPGSRAELRELVDAAGGTYSYWETGRRATLRELLVNEGLAVEVARAVSPGHAEWEYYGYSRRQYARAREMEGVLMRFAAPHFDEAGLGLRLRYLSDGTSVEARTVEHHVLPERSGYYLGSRLVERAAAERGFPWAVRADAREIVALARPSAATA